MVHLTSMFKAWLPNQMRRITGGAGTSSEEVSAGTNSEGVNRRPMVFVIPIIREGPRPRGISVCETIVQYAGVTIGVTALWEWCRENNGFRRTWDFIRRNWITVGLSVLAMFYVDRVRLRITNGASTSAVARPSPATNSASAAPSPATNYVAAPATISAPGPSPATIFAAAPATNSTAAGSRLNMLSL